MMTCFWTQEEKRTFQGSGINKFMGLRRAARENERGENFSCRRKPEEISENHQMVKVVETEEIELMERLRRKQIYEEETPTEIADHEVSISIYEKGSTEERKRKKEIPMVCPGQCIMNGDI